MAPDNLRVLSCLPRSRPGTPLPAVLGAAAGLTLSEVGPRPGKEIDELLSGRLLVVGDDADLAAVAVRLLRRERLDAVVLAYAAVGPTAVTDLYSLPVGPAAVALAQAGDPDPVPLVRDDVGGVLVGRGDLGPVTGTVYVDEHRVAQRSTARLTVWPDPERGLEVAITPRRLLVLPRRPRRHRGRAVQIGTAGGTVVRDGVRFDRPVTTWTWYRHTRPLRLVRGVL